MVVLHRSLAAVALCAIGVSASVTLRPATTSRKHPAEIEELADRARSAPAEFAADALIRIAESDKVQDPAWKRELLEDAFQRAGSAQHLFKRRIAVTDNASSRASFLSRAFLQDLDACSLQCRVVQAMLAVDRQKARELFNEIPAPNPPKVTCDDALVYDVSIFYQTLGKIAQETFSPKERKNEDHIQFLAGYIQQISSPVQVAPVANMLASLNIATEQLEVLVQSFAAALGRISGDDRSFSFTTRKGSSMPSSVEQLALACRRRGMSNNQLLQAFRSYLVHNYTGSRCVDSTASISLSVVTDSRTTQASPPDAATFFNDKLRLDAYPPGDAVQPLSADDLRPGKVEGSLKTPKAPELAGMQELTAKYRELLFSPGGTPYTSEQKNTAEWHSRLEEFLSTLDGWQEEGDSNPGDYFREKCLLYSSLANIVPDGRDRGVVMGQLLAFLQTNSFQQQNRIEWFFPVNSLIARVFAEGPALSSISVQLRSSDDPVISLYADLEQFMPRSLQRTVGLF